MIKIFLDSSDKIIPCEICGHNRGLLRGQFPESYEGYLRVPSVFEKENWLVSKILKLIAIRKYRKILKYLFEVYLHIRHLKQYLTYLKDNNKRMDISRSEYLISDEFFSYECYNRRKMGGDYKI